MKPDNSTKPGNIKNKSTTSDVTNAKGHPNVIEVNMKLVLIKS